MRVKPNQNAGITASAPESEAKITDGTSNTMMFAESSKAKKPFANDSFETSTPKAMQAELMFDTLHRQPVDKTSEQQVESPKDQLSGFMDYTDDSCVAERAVKARDEN